MGTRYPCKKEQKSLKAKHAKSNCFFFANQPMQLKTSLAHHYGKGLVVPVLHPEHSNSVFVFSRIDNQHDNGCVLQMDKVNLQQLQDKVVLATAALPTSITIQKTILPVKNGFLLYDSGNNGELLHVSMQGHVKVHCTIGTILSDHAPVIVQNKVYVVVQQYQSDSKEQKIVTYDYETMVQNEFTCPKRIRKVINFDDDHVLLVEAGTLHDYCALLMNIHTGSMVPYLLLCKIGTADFMVHLSKKMMICIAYDTLSVVNKVSHVAKTVPFAAKETIRGAIVLPKEENTPYQVLMGTSNGKLLVVTIPEKMLSEPIPYVVPPTVAIKTQTEPILVHKAIVACRIPIALESNGNLLDWSFASLSASRKVVDYLYTGDIDIHSNSKDKEDVSKIANHIDAKPLLALVSELDSKNVPLSQWLLKFAQDGSVVSSPQSKPFSDAMLAFKSFVEGNVAEANSYIAKASKAHPGNISIERLVKTIQFKVTGNITRIVGLLETDFASMVNNPLASDITLVINGKKYFAHLYFLTRSPFIMTMKELNAEDNELVIDMTQLLPTLNETTFLYVMRYAYTDNAGISKQHSIAEVQNILHAANFFGFELLKENAENWLCLQVREENALALLEFGYTMTCSSLCKCAAKLVTQTSDAMFAMKDVISNDNAVQKLLDLHGKFSLGESADISNGSVVTIVPKESSTSGYIALRSPFILNKGVTYKCMLNADASTELLPSFELSLSSTKAPGTNMLLEKESIESKQVEFCITVLPPSMLPALHGTRAEVAFLVRWNDCTELKFYSNTGKADKYLVIRCKNTKGACSIQVADFTITAAIPQEYAQLNSLPYLCSHCHKQVTLAASTNSCFNHKKDSFLTKIDMGGRADMSDNSQIVHSCCNTNNPGCVYREHLFPIRNLN